MGGSEGLRDCVYVGMRVCFRVRRGEKKKKIKISLKKGGGKGRSVRLFSGRLNVLTARRLSSTVTVVFRKVECLDSPTSALYRYRCSQEGSVS